MELQNTSTEERIWPSLQFVDGRTLELGPGEVGDVAVGHCPRNSFLAPPEEDAPKKKAGKRTGHAAHGAHGPEDEPRGTSDVDPTAGSHDPSSDNDPAADADGKEA